MTGDKPLVLVDGSSYLFRAYHALPKLTTATGHPTGAVKGVIAMLRKLMKEYPGSPIAVVFDAKGKTFRDEIYAEYKANRFAMPDDLRPQVEPIFEIIRAMGVPLLIVEGVEADDVIGTLATVAARVGRATVISASDKDMAQLVNAHTTLVDSMSETRFDRAGVIEKFGVPPERIIDYLALIGDSVDNVPGVPKVGPKTAAKWLADYGTLEGVIAAAGEIKGKVGENLRESVSFLPMSKRLTTIKTDVVLPIDIDALERQPQDDARLRELFERFEFRQWVDELATTAPPALQAPVERSYATIASVAELDRWIERARAADVVAIHVKTNGADYMTTPIVAFALAVAPGEAAYLPVGHDYAGAPDQIPVEEALPRLKPFLEDASRAKVGQNLKLDKNVLALRGVELDGIKFDTMLESYVIDSVGSRHQLEDLAARHLGVRTIHYGDIAGKGAKQIPFSQVGVDSAAAFAAEEADIALQLHAVMWPKLEAVPGLKRVFETIEMPLVGVLSRIERTGARVDPEKLARQSEELATRMQELTEAAYSQAGETFNLDSPKQLQSILYGKLGIPPPKKTASGQLSTAEPVLQELSLDYALPRTILEYRSVAKLKSTYTDTLPRQINPATGRIHTTYQQAVAATGRLSSAEPNLQNIPIRTAEGRRIRQAFVAPPGKVLIAADYSQIELRIMAHLSGDPSLKRAFEQNLDVHRATAADVFERPIEAVTADQRRSAKTINFGLIYGMSAFGLARQLGVSRAVAQEYIARYFARFPGVRDYMDRVRARAHSDGFVETVFGRRLYLPEINDRNVPRRQAAERTAINAPMQGTAADIIKRAMIAVDAWLAASRLDAAMILQVHDELVLEVAERDADAVAAGVAERMAGAAALDVPLVVDLGRGANWDEAH